MEKMKWTRPEVTGEMFEANEYVAACITGTIQCMYPGTSPTDQDDGTKTYIDSASIKYLDMYRKKVLTQ